MKHPLASRHDLARLRAPQPGQPRHIDQVISREWCPPPCGRRCRVTALRPFCDRKWPIAAVADRPLSDTRVYATQTLRPLSIRSHYRPAHAVHQPFALTNLSWKSGQGPSIAPSLPEYKSQLPQVSGASQSGRFASPGNRPRTPSSRAIAVTAFEIPALTWTWPAPLHPCLRRYLQTEGW